MWTILGKLLVGAIGLGALFLLLAWLVEWAFVESGDASAVGGKPSWWAGLVYTAVVIGAVVALVKG
jgi:hypothetical protein